MERRHLDLLKNLLERVAFDGYAVVPKWKLRRWCAHSNFTSAVQEEIITRWKALLEEELSYEKAPHLRFIEVNDKDMLLLHHTMVKYIDAIPKKKTRKVIHPTVDAIPKKETKKVIFPTRSTYKRDITYSPLDRS